MQGCGGERAWPSTGEAGELRLSWGLSGTALKVLAMACMLVDHIWGVFMTGHVWMTCVGRLAFPIFAFLVAEGYAHTSNFRRYLGRMLLFALLSELPYNRMTGGWINPLGQNVLFTFCLALLLMRLMDKARRRGRLAGLAAVAVGSAAGFVLGFVGFVDYLGYGVLMVLVFWLCPARGWGRLAQLAALWYINWEMMGGLHLELTWGTGRWMLPVQGFALLGLLPIWLYNGRRGLGGKAAQYGCYLVYPAHMLLLVLLRMALG